jgi:hypothetical protein
MPPEVAESNGKIVFEHKLSFEKVLILTFDFFVLLRSQTFHGFAIAAFIAWKLTVSSVITNAPIIAAANTHHVSCPK